MKKLVVLGLVALMLLPLLAVGCSGGTTSNTPKAQTVTVKLDEFSSNANITKNVEMAKGDTLTVKLESNASTGYSWGDAEISNAAVLVQASRNFEEPTATGIVGAPGNDVIVFTATNTGSANIKIAYGRPWESEALYNLTINVTIK
jgi:inhibitor of cysteine peptidase